MELSRSDIHGEHLARCINFYKQFKNELLENYIDLKNAPYKMLYRKYADIFCKTASILSKYNIDIEKYAKYFVEVKYVNDKSLKDFLMNATTFKDFIEYEQINTKYKKIYRWYIKSVKNIAVDAYMLGYFTAKDYLNYIISSNQLGNKVLSGKISRYYLAAIPKFQKIIPKLDSLSKDELADLRDRFDIYSTDIIKAYMHFRNIKPNPIKMTNDAISKLREKYQRK